LSRAPPERGCVALPPHPPAPAKGRARGNMMSVRGRTQAGTADLDMRMRRYNMETWLRTTSIWGAWLPVWPARYSHSYGPQFGSRDSPFVALPSVLPALHLLQSFSLNAVTQIIS
jgi:hypothetical protein